MRDFFVPKDLLLYSDSMGMNSDFSVRGFSAGASEALATLTITLSHANTAPWTFDDTGETDAATTTSGNVLTNDNDVDLDALTVSQVAGSAANVGVAVAGSGGGLFTIASDGAWTFDPSGDFASLTGSDTAETSVTYYASDGQAEAMGTLTVTVSSGAAPELWTPAEITRSLHWDVSHTGSVSIISDKISQIADLSGNNRHAIQSTSINRPGVMQAGDVIVPTFNGSNQWFQNLASFSARFWFAVAQTNAVKAWAGLVTATNSELALGSSGSAVFQGTGDAARVNGAVATNVGLSTPFVWAITKAAAVTGTRTVGQEFNAPGSGRAWTGRVMEVIALPAAPSIDDLMRIEGYAAHKWDALLGVTTLVSALPSDHPYKSAPPTI